MFWHRPMKNVVYTSLVGTSDHLLQPLFIREDYDYICFSNDFEETSIGVWKIRKIPYDEKDDRRLSRYAKLLPHRVLQEYDYSIWMDANLQIITDVFYKAVDAKVHQNCLVAQVPHPLHDCIYDDIRSAYLGGRVKLKPSVRQYHHLKEEGFPKHEGLYENNLILRKHNDPSVIKISELWWKEYEAYTNRDQFSLSYVYWKYQFKPDYLLGNNKNARNVDCIKYHKHTLRGSWLRRNPILRFFARNTRIAIRYVLMKIYFD